MSTERHYLIEEKTHGMFAVRAGGSWRTNRIVKTQSAATRLVKALNPKDKSEVTRFSRDEPLENPK